MLSYQMGMSGSCDLAAKRTKICVKIDELAAG